MNAIELQNLSCGYSPTNIILCDLCGTLHHSSLTALLGENGIGKSTLLRTICGVQPGYGGQLLVEGEPLSDMQPRRLARTISIVNTDVTGAGGLTVEELVALGRHPFTGFFGRLTRYDRDIVTHALRQVGMNHARNSFVATLSDGMRQKVMIARALAQTTPIIILDEPTAFLDAASRIETLQLLRDLAVTRQKAILISTHDIGQVLPLASHLWLLTHSRRLVTGPTASLTSQPEIMDTLFGDRPVKFDPVRNDYR
ncbi:MAG: ABC transporter ATP-binding protein [Muribaculaceae bacterium]|nr:ABC transporter ATP-binding protein [Muribaculaceae bacterium]